MTTPVPPTPAISTLCTPSSAACRGSGKLGSAAAASGRGGLRFAPRSVTKLGQKPFKQLKSWLHDDWLMRRLRPNSVSSAITDRQFDCTLQSPQPSQTSSLMTTRRSGVGTVPRLRLRCSSAAHV